MSDKGYQVLARKWRPQKFAEMVGQEHITRTLQNAIQQKRVGHAYLFVGPRGTGKTTTARILAKALNCENPDGTEPCGLCQNCREIAGGNSMDVREIDGASHNKVEDIRDIRDGVGYAPARSKYRIYIIDEVHMLTPAAWNALLKTLEEPPPHVKFIFATTEPHKVLPTILSRCQRFDLKPIPVPLIVGQLRKIIAPENIHIEDAALAAIARAAEGGMRDAQSIVDQIIAFCGGHDAGRPITEEDVINVFGLASSVELRNLAEGMVRNDMNQIFGILQDLADRGRDLERLYDDLLSYVRDLMICAVTKDPQKILQLENSQFAELKTVAGNIRGTVVQRLLQGLVEAAPGIRTALNKRVYLEAVLTRVTYEAHSLQINDLIERINQLRQGGGIPAIPAGPAAAALANPVSAPTAPAAGQKKNELAAGSPLPALPSRPPPAVATPVSQPPPVAAAPVSLPPPVAATPVSQPPPVVAVPVSQPPVSSSRPPPAAAMPPPPNFSSLTPFDDAPPPARPTVTAPPPAPKPPVPPPAAVPAPQPPVQPQAAMAPTTAPVAMPPPKSEEPDTSGSDDDAGDDEPAANCQTPATAIQPPPLPEDPDGDDVDEIIDEESVGFNKAAIACWNKMLPLLRRDKAVAGIIKEIEKLKPTTLINQALILVYAGDTPAPMVERLNAEATQLALQKAIHVALARNDASAMLRRQMPHFDSKRHRLLSSPKILEATREEPLVKQTITLFKGELIDARQIESLE